MAQPQPSLAVPSRIEKLNAAAALYQFDKALNRSAWSSMGWGILCVVIGRVLLSTNKWVGWVNIAVGTVLMLEGLYQKRVREPKVIVVSAATLGLLGLWNLFGLIIGLVIHTKTGGHLLTALLQLGGAWTIYTAYSAYASLVSSSDPGTNMELEAMLHQLRIDDPSSAPWLVEFTSHKFGKTDVRWRAQRFDDMFLFAGNEMILGRKQSWVTCFVVPRQSVKISTAAEKLPGKNQKITITAGDQQFETTVSFDMAQKFMTLLA